ncbi:helix-turn-helix transcriptional regulator [Microvirga guangxiensis]|uniref:DNA-binding transcriptional regulator, CsgD family n=1 Tax=Microvirga guangxiensis TaxID=549386 RepID=A0A1G5K4C1_9HYPH|nr:helix-turn-helix transcriptional regulator [Microvirga guangxiensis]SCY94920.1 DNA-binding transcriptional regulator, CsgD family [Microvirga guangxiensis]
MPVAEAFYEAAILPELWPKALDLASAAWSADGVIISTYPDCVGGVVASESLEEMCARFVREEWYKHDVRAARGVPVVRKGKEIVTDQDIFTKDELEHLPLFAEFLRPQGLGWFAGSILSEVGGALTTLSIHRKVDKEPFSDDAASRIHQDLRDMQRAARLAASSRAAFADGLIDGIERFDCGAVLLDRLGRVTRMNRKAEEFLGEDLQVISSRLRSQQREANKALQELIAASTQTTAQIGNNLPAPIFLNRINNIPLIVSSYPVVRQANDVFQGARAILLIRDLSGHRPVALDILQKVFGLTTAEVRVAASLLKGSDTQQIAAEHKVSPETIRYHLKSMFAKTGTNHQAQLVSLLARFPKSNK